MTADIIIYAACFLLSSAVVYGIWRNEQQLIEFRANLRPGDLVRVKTSTGIVPARIMKRSNSSYSVMNIDTREPLLTAITNIYQP